MGIIPLVYSVFIVFFPLISVFSFTPYMWRKDSAFGVRLAKEFKNNAQIKSLCHQYTAFSVIAGVCFTATSLMLRNSYIMITCAVIYVILCFLMFVGNNRLVRNIIAVNDYENIQKPVYIKSITEEFKIKTISYFWLLLLIIPLAISFYDAYKNPADIFYTVPIIQVAVIIADIIGFFLIKRTKQYVNKHTATEDMKRNKTVRKQLSVLILVLSLMLSVFLTLMQLSNSGTKSYELFMSVAPAFVTILVMVCIIVFCIKINK